MDNTIASSIECIPASALTARLYELRRQERELLVEFLRNLAEVDRRKVHLELGFPSLFAFLTDHLGYSKAAAFRRSTAARLLSRFSAIGPYLADGRLCLTTLVELRDVLDHDTLGAILDRAAGRTEDEVKELVAALRPQPAPRDLLRRLPTQPALPLALGPAPEQPVSSGPAPAPPASRPPATVKPITDELRVLRMTVDRGFVADLEAARAALSHVVPDGKFEKVIHECLRRTLREVARRRGLAGPRRAATKVAPQPGPGGRYIPAAVRREVWMRDDARCAFVGSDGHRCDSTVRLQVHHLQPFADGGPATADNLSLFCAAHNQYQAAKDGLAERRVSDTSAPARRCQLG